jgi:hypothetical protein
LAETREGAAPPVETGEIAAGLVEPLEAQGHGVRGDASRIRALRPGAKAIRNACN